MEWNKAHLGQAVRSTRELKITGTTGDDGSNKIPIGTIGVIRDIVRPGNAKLPGVQVEWQFPDRPLTWCAGFEVELT